MKFAELRNGMILAIQGGRRTVQGIYFIHSVGKDSVTSDKYEMYLSQKNTMIELRRRYVITSEDWDSPNYALLEAQPINDSLCRRLTKAIFEVNTINIDKKWF
jgi:hypothetical protein